MPSPPPFGYLSCHLAACCVCECRGCVHDKSHWMQFTEKHFVRTFRLKFVVFHTFVIRIFCCHILSLLLLHIAAIAQTSFRLRRHLLLDRKWAITQKYQYQLFSTLSDSTASEKIKVERRKEHNQGISKHLGKIASLGVCVSSISGYVCACVWVCVYLACVKGKHIEQQQVPHTNIRQRIQMLDSQNNLFESNEGSTKIRGKRKKYSRRNFRNNNEKKASKIQKCDGTHREN